MNSDESNQCNSFDWTNRMMPTGVRSSMDGRGRSIDNVFSESLFRSFKCEGVLPRVWEPGLQAKAGIGLWMTFYNHQ